MFLLILLKNQKVKLLVPLKWIQNLKIKELLNYGVYYQRKIEYTVSYSPTISDEPDFTLDLQPVFKKNRIGCYRATILKPFASFEEGMKHIVIANGDENMALDDSDVEYIQNVLDESSDEDDFMAGQIIPRPITRNE